MHTFVPHGGGHSMLELGSGLPGFACSGLRGDMPRLPTKTCFTHSPGMCLMCAFKCMQ